MGMSMILYTCTPAGLVCAYLVNLISKAVYYTRVLTRVQLTSSLELSSNPPMDVGGVNPGKNPDWGIHTGGESGLIEFWLEPSLE